MPKFFWFAFFLVLIAYPFQTAIAAADIDGHDSFAVGIQGGMTFSDLATSGNVTSASRTGFVAGIALELRLFDLFYLAPEASFAQRGATFTNASGYSLNAYSDTIEVPVFAKFKFGGQVQPYVFAGPDFIFDIANNFSEQGAGPRGNPFSYHPNPVDLAADFGVGLESGIYFANLRYSLGLLDVSSNSSSWRSRGFQLLMGLKFG